MRFSSNLADYDLISDVGGVDDISFLYLAKHNPTGDMVALQYTDLTLSPDYEFIEELIRSVHNAKMCKHPNILPYLHSFIQEERLWSVTYPVKAGSCRTILKSHFPNGFGEDVVADIRAGNILIDQGGHVRITGLRHLAHLSQNGEYVQSVFSLVGDNIEWAAPEVMAQNSNYDEKADVYSIGITALELAHNRTPFDDWPPLKVLLCKMEYECPALQAVDKSMSKNFNRFIQACLSKDPGMRPSVQDLLEFPFIKQSRGSAYIEQKVVKAVLDGVVVESPVADGGDVPPSASASQQAGSSKTTSNEAVHVSTSLVADTAGRRGSGHAR
ncbi:kinase-like domain-containing protein [Entophlyctis helioformis]|nr:kinase-like domain-containing protein [Entophlyctis helioformis]